MMGALERGLSKDYVIEGLVEILGLEALYQSMIKGIKKKLPLGFSMTVGRQVREAHENMLRLVKESLDETLTYEEACELLDVCHATPLLIRRKLFTDTLGKKIVEKL
jgi:hypothetical protein